MDLVSDETTVIYAAFNINLLSFFLQMDANYIVQGSHTPKTKSRTC